MAITPDTKDWTWVLHARCPACGFDAAALVPSGVGPVLRDTLPRWQQVLRRPAAGTRPNGRTWSPLEYAAHVADVCIVFRGRLEQMLASENPGFADWDQDAAAAGYGDRTPEQVGGELTDAASAAAAAFDAVPVTAWDRPGVRSDGTSFTVTTLGQYLVHELIHHLHDVAG